MQWNHDELLRNSAATLRQCKPEPNGVLQNANSYGCAVGPLR
jgi:hypothetical protein